MSDNGLTEVEAMRVRRLRAAWKTDRDFMAAEAAAAAIRQRDEARAEVERLREEVAEARRLSAVDFERARAADDVLEEELVKRGKVIEERDEARAEVDRLQKQREKFRSDVEGMPNTIISRRAKRHVLAALDGAR